MNVYFLLGIFCGIIIENFARWVGRKIAQKIIAKRKSRLKADEPESEVKNE